MVDVVMRVLATHVGTIIHRMTTPGEALGAGYWKPVTLDGQMPQGLDVEALFQSQMICPEPVWTFMNLHAGARTGDFIDVERCRACPEDTELLGQLRGVATKIGQMMSYVDGLIPPEHREAFEQTMAKLQSAAPESDPVEIRALVERELGAPIAELFESWNDKPVASASIGQVHRATLEGGRVVAVKVQHPGIVEAMDLKCQCH